jgi:hypothetical protein
MISAEGRKTLKLILWVFASLAILVGVLLSVKTDTIPSAASPSSAASNEKTLVLLTEQKNAAQDVAEKAAALIADGRSKIEVKHLYESRLSEITQLRASVAKDEVFTLHDKQRIDSALQVDEEAATQVLAKYADLYGR